MRPRVTDGLAHGVERAWRWLGRPSVLTVLIIALLALLVLGALLPQLPANAPGNDQLSEWRALARSRYGSLAPLLEAAGAFDLYRSPLMWGVAALLGAATLSCTLRRWPGRWRSIFGPRNGAADARAEVEAFSHVEIVELTIAGAPRSAGTATVAAVSSTAAPRIDELAEVARRTLALHDFRVRLEGTTDLVRLRGDRNRLAGLGTLIDHIAMLLVLGGVCLTALLGWRDTLTIEPGGAVEVGHGSGITLGNEGFEIERYPDGSPAAYSARVTLGEGGVTAARTLGVNHPVSEKGIRFYLMGYRQEEGRYALTLLAVHDPGVGAVIVGGVLFLAGLFVAIYFPRSSVRVRIVDPRGTLRLTGWADSRAYDFDRDFAELAADLRRRWHWEATG